MAKHKIGDTVRHSRHGDGKITGTSVVVRTPPPFDRVKLDGEKWHIKARLAEIEAILARGDQPHNEDMYSVEFTGGRHEEYTEQGIDKLKARAT